MIDVKNRVPKYPGRVKMTPVSGQVNIYDMERADDPREEGTPINRELFMQMQDDIYYHTAPKIGDTLTTMRKDLGDKWLLCNGEYIDPAVYPQLAELCPESISVAEFITSNVWGNSTNVNNKINSIAYGDGYWVAGGVYNDGSNTHSYIAYATSLAGPWTTKSFKIASNSDNESRYLHIDKVIYENGYWVAVGANYVNNQYVGQMYYTTNLAGEWAEKQLWSSSQGSVDSSVKDITYENGYWVAVGGCRADSTHQACMAYTTDLAGEWMYKKLWNSNVQQTMATCVKYSNGYWIVGGQLSQITGVAYSTDLAGTFTIKELWGNSNYESKLTGIAEHDGQVVVVGMFRKNSGDRAAYIAYTSNITGEWTQKELFSLYEEYCLLTDVIYVNEQWMASGYKSKSTTYTAIVMFAESPDGVWTERALWDGSTSGEADCLTFANGMYAFGGIIRKGSTYNAHIAYADAKYVLPVITGPAYTYIKALEG